MYRLTQLIAAVLVLLAVALGGYAWWLGSRTPATPSGTAAAGPAAAPVATFPVVVTRRKVAAGEPLVAEALQVVKLPIDPPGAVRDLPAATGRVPVADLEPGALVLESGLAAGLALRLADGERAVAIRADEVLGVANRVRPGDFVDVFVMLKTDGREVARSQARLLLSRQRVLAYGGASVDGLTAADGSAAGGSAARTIDPARTAVLAVPVQDVARLALGEANGRLLLALRHPGDTAMPEPMRFAALAAATARPIDQAQAGLAMADLAGGGSALPASPPTSVLVVAPSTNGMTPAARPRAPASTAPARTGIEIESIRGDRREIVSY